MELNVTSLAVFTALAIVIFLIKDIGRRPRDYPPGPPTLPLIGNLHLMPAERRHVQFKKWAEEYGSETSLPLLRVAEFQY